MPHILGHTPPPPPSTSNGLPPALPGGVYTPGATTSVLGSSGSKGAISLVLGAAAGAALGFLVMGPIGGLVGALAGAGAVMLINRNR